MHIEALDLAVIQAVKCLTTDWKTRVWIPAKAKNFSLTSVSKPATRPTQPPIQWAPGAKGGRGVTLTAHPHLVPRSRMSRRYTSSPAWRQNGGSRTALLSFTLCGGISFHRNVRRCFLITTRCYSRSHSQDAVMHVNTCRKQEVSRHISTDFCAAASPVSSTIVICKTNHRLMVGLNHNKHQYLQWLVGIICMPNSNTTRPTINVNSLYF
jgi:hypothetical protein